MSTLTLEEIKQKATAEYIKRVTSRNFQNTINLEDGKIYNLISTMVDSISASLTGGGGGGEANTMSNTGTGEGLVYKEKIGDDLIVKSLKAGSNVTITNDVNEIIISAVSVAAVAVSVLNFQNTGTFLNVADFISSLGVQLI